jgi:hypothetical protein
MARMSYGLQVRFKGNCLHKPKGEESREVEECSGNQSGEMNVSRATIGLTGSIKKSFYPNLHL